MSTTTAARPVPRQTEAPAAPGWGRAAAVGALLALVLHGVTGLQHAHDPLFSALVLLMSLGCAACSWRCLRTPCRRELTALLGMSAAMVVVHLAWVFLAGGGHTHGGPSPAATPEHAGATLSMLGLALAELAVAALCAVALRRAIPSPAT